MLTLQDLNLNDYNSFEKVSQYHETSMLHITNDQMIFILIIK